MFSKPKGDSQRVFDLINLAVVRNYLIAIIYFKTLLRNIKNESATRISK